MEIHAASNSDPWGHSRSPEKMEHLHSFTDGLGSVQYDVLSLNKNPFDNF